MLKERRKRVGEKERRGKEMGRIGRQKKGREKRKKERREEKREEKGGGKGKKRGRVSKTNSN
jgi:hypothetical protein